MLTDHTPGTGEAVPDTSAHSGLVRLALSGPTMGTRYSAALYVPEERTAIGPALQASVDTVDRQMSTWIVGSDLMRFNRAETGQWMALPTELLTVLAKGLEIGRVAHGAFDMGVGDLVAAWGFGSLGRIPDVAAIRQLADGERRPTHEVLELDLAHGRARKQAPLTLDLSGIAKGYGVDRLAETLEAFGVTSYLVSIDGELRAGEPKPGGEPWRVAVERPDRRARDIAGVVALTHGALATSGDYRHAVTLDGHIVSHTMDPRIGQPLDNGIAAVTVRASTCMVADAWATALLVLGPDKGLPLAKANNIEAMFAVNATDEDVAR